MNTCFVYVCVNTARLDSFARARANTHHYAHFGEHHALPKAYPSSMFTFSLFVAKSVLSAGGKANDPELKS